MKKLLLLLLFIATMANAEVVQPPPPTLELTTITLSQFDLDIKARSYLRPDGSITIDDGEYAYDLATFTVDTSGDYTIRNTFFNALYVGVDNDYTQGNDTLIAPNTPSWMADTMIYVYDELPNISTPENPLYFADNDDNDNYEGENADGDLLFSLTGSLTAETDYWAIITTYDPKVVGFGNLEITGPGAVDIRAVIPEPSTYALLASYCLFLYVAIKRRK
tara:strand:- start:2390 stop:3049 length:660 start_codon:yes stop_codon:yes gene_type:complete